MPSRKSTFLALPILLAALSSNQATAALVPFELRLDAPLELNTGYYPWPDTTPPGTSSGQSYVTIGGRCDDVLLECNATITLTSFLNQVEISPGNYYTPVIDGIFFNLQDESLLPSLAVHTVVPGKSKFIFNKNNGVPDGVSLTAGTGGEYIFDAFLLLDHPVLPAVPGTRVEFNAFVATLFALSEGSASPVSAAVRVKTRFADTDEFYTYIGTHYEDRDLPSVPEPGSMALLVLGLLGLAGIRRSTRA